MPPTLITGATGFVGSAVARVLLARGHTLRLFVRPGGDRRNIAGLDAELAEGDLRDPASLAAAADGCRYLVHVAADYRLWVPDPEAMMQANVAGTRALLLAAQSRGVERMVYCSSVAALGLVGDGTVADETTPVHPEKIIGIYKKSKYLAEQAVLDLVREHAMPVVIVNPVDAGGAARHQAHADRQDDPRCRRGAHAGLCGDRAEHRARGRRGGGPRAGAGSAAWWASATYWAGRISRWARCSRWSPRWPAGGRRG